MKYIEMINLIKSGNNPLDRLMDLECALFYARRAADQIREAEKEDFEHWLENVSNKYETENGRMEQLLRDSIYDWSADVFHLSSAPLSGWIWIRCR